MDIKYLVETENFRKLSPEATKAFLLLFERAGQYKVIRQFSIKKQNKLWNEKPELSMPKSENKIISIINELIDNEFITYNKKTKELHIREIRNKQKPYRNYILQEAEDYISGIPPQDWWFNEYLGQTRRLRPADINDLMSIDGIHRSEYENYLSDARGNIVPKECAKEVA